MDYEYSEIINLKRLTAALWYNFNDTKLFIGKCIHEHMNRYILETVSRLTAVKGQWQSKTTSTFSTYSCINSLYEPYIIYQRK